MTVQQVQLAAEAGANFLDLETTMIPGNLRKQLSVLEVLLRGIVNGQLVVITTQQIAVESAGSEGPEKPAA